MHVDAAAKASAEPKRFLPQKRVLRVLLGLSAAGLVVANLCG